MKQGLLIINLGTPDNPSISAVRRYLREFLADKRVISIPALFRYLLLYTVILPFRTRRSAHAYKSIWTSEGSPLLCNSRKLANKLQSQLGAHCKIVLGMRYGKPSIQDALSQLQRCEKITIFPLYPQYSSAATGSSIEKALQLLATQPVIPSINIIRDFHAHLLYINAQAALLKPYVADHDYILFSYHGVPESHLLQSGCKQICKENCPIVPINSACYRAQCFNTTRLVAKKLGLTDKQHGAAFQSRLGKAAWIKPYTDKIVAELISQGIKRLAIVCPSFVADCLETLEEIGIRMKATWLEMGGEQLTLIPCLNDSDLWVNAVIGISEIDMDLKNN